MKVNEAIYRSPKWLRNVLDYEISTGKDIKGQPSLKMKEKLAREKAERENAEQRMKYERWKKEQEDNERKRERDKKKREADFNVYFDYVENYIISHYKECTISIPADDEMVIEKKYLKVSGYDFEFKITLYSKYRIPTFNIYIRHSHDEYSYRASGFDYTKLKIFMVNIVYEWYKSSGYKKQGYNGNYDSGRSQYKDPPRRKPDQPNKNESDPVKNRQRRLNLLRQTLEGYERTLKNTPNGPDRDQLMNEIEVIKGRIKVMENPKNESYKHLMSFQLFEKQFNPIKDDYVMITYSLTGEPTPVRILKTYPNNTYLVSFDVEGSTAKGAPNATIRNSDIISPYKSIKSPVGSGFISANTNFQVRNTSNVNQVSNDMYL